MRITASLSLLLVLAVWGCDGDSSSLMSVWNDSGPTSVMGGQGGSVAGDAAVGSGGQNVVASGGSGGGSGGGSVAVRGGIRDLATAQCTTTTGLTCPVPTDYIACVRAHCNPNLTDCHYSDGVATAAGGRCTSYANCMLGCPCDASERRKCEQKCTDDYATANPDCSSCLLGLYSCTTQHGCIIPTSCTAPPVGF